MTGNFVVACGVGFRGSAVRANSASDGAALVDDEEEEEEEEEEDDEGEGDACKLVRMSRTR